MALIEEHSFACPHCWQTITISLDLSVSEQSIIQDCEVCCNPAEIDYTVEDGQVVSFSVRDIGQ